MLKGATLKLMCRSVLAQLEYSAVVQVSTVGAVGEAWRRVGREDLRKAVADSKVLLRGTSSVTKDDHEGFIR